MNLEEVAQCLRGNKGAQGAYMFGVSKAGFQSFFADVNARMLAGKKEVSQVEFDSMVLAANGAASKPNVVAAQPRLPAPAQLAIAGPIEMSIGQCLEIVSGLEAKRQSSSIMLEVCETIRTRLAQLQEDGTAAITKAAWDKLFDAASRLAEGRRMLEIKEREITIQDGLANAIKRKLAAVA